MSAGAQTNCVTNTDRGLIFWEGADIAFNYKTGQWTALPAYNGTQYFGYNGAEALVGLIRESSGSYDFQTQDSTGVAQDGVLATGDFDLNSQGRAFVSAVRPLHDGGTATVRIGSRDNLTDSISWTASTSINSRSRAANFRDEARYHRMEVTVTGTFSTILGADVEFEPSGWA